MEKIIIAIDGFSSSGKSTMAKNLAKTIGYTYIDTGAMYRAVTLYSLENGIICNGEVDEKKLQELIDQIDIVLSYNPQTSRPDTYLNGINVEEKIRGIEVARYVSQIAALGFVRKSLVSKQQSMGKSKGIVMDGRDVGTVIFPEAELKIFVTASPEVRAQRRWEEMKAKGDKVSYEEILENVKERDRIDSTRTEGPLRQAEDARVLDNSHLSIEEQQAWLLNQYEEVIRDI